MSSALFRSLTHVHEFLNRLFIEYQSRLMQRDFTGAIEQLNELQHKYLLHIADEEKILIPLYKKVVQPPPQGGAVEFYLREHAQIKRYFVEFTVEVTGWQNDGAFTPIKLVRLFDRHYSLQDLLNHHHAREDNFLYRWLDRRLDLAERKQIIEQLSDVTDK